MRIVINGKFLTQQLTGVQRYAFELVKRLDLLCEKNQIELIVPIGTLNVPSYNNIKIVYYGKLKGALWEQISYPKYLLNNEGIGLNLCNSSPLIKPDIVCIHDINFKINPKFFSKKFGYWYRLQMINDKFRAKKILTVSKFSKKEIIRVYGVNKEKIAVISNGWNHFPQDIDNNNIFQKFSSIKKDDYILCVSSLAPTKNFSWVSKNARYNPKQQYVIAGGLNPKVFKKLENFHFPSNVIFVGYVSDEDIVVLMKHCKAFLFPSFYEGFGIPPLEALSVGARIIVSDIPSLREVYEDSAYYINPNEPKVKLNLILKQPAHDKGEILKKYNWNDSAMKLWRILSQ